MYLKNFGQMAKISAALSAIVLLSMAPRTARGDSFTVTQLAAGVQTSATTTNVENFNETSPGFGTTTNFNGSGITGTYSGNFTINKPDQYGAAGGTGFYIDTTTPGGNPGTYTLTLSKQVDYFGLWFSALDQGNQLSFFDTAISTTVPVFTFSPANYAALVGACPNALSGYCGNPNSPFLGNDSGQQYAYLNFLDTSGTFNEVVFTENPAVGQFESDNHAVAQNVTTIPGQLLTPTPEPSSLVLLGSGILAAAGMVRRKVMR
jgi:PEP-CTERM motif